MNPGYISLLLMTVALILFASGWKDFILRGITNKVILLFFVVWLVGMKFPISTRLGQIHLNVVLLCIVIVWVFVRSHGHLYRLHLLSIGILLGSVTFFLLETLHLAPFLVIVNEDITIAIIVALLVALMTRNAAVQIAVASLGLLLGDTYFRYLHKEHLGIQLGTVAFQDLWWLTVFLTRGISMVIISSLFVCKKSVLWLVSERNRNNNGRE